MKYQAIDAAISAVSSFGVVGCGTLLSVPVIGLLLSGGCRIGVGIATSAERAEASDWYHNSLRNC